MLYVYYTHSKLLFFNFSAITKKAENHKGLQLLPTMQLTGLEPVPSQPGLDP